MKRNLMKELALYGRKYPYRIQELQRPEVNTVAKQGCGCGGDEGNSMPQRPSLAKRAVMLAPVLGQGYLVLNKAGNPSVRSWKITVQIVKYNTSGSPSYRTVQSIKLDNGLNYWQVPKQYRSIGSGIHKLNVEGYDAQGALVTQEVGIPVNDGPETAACPGCEAWTKRCTWVCNGRQNDNVRGYAWAINLYDDPNTNAFYLNLQTAYALFDEEQQIAIPFYSYFPLEQFQTFFQSDPLNNPYYLPAWMYNNGVDVVGPFNGTIENEYKDDDGNTIIGAVMGVAKNLGPWEGQYWQTPVLAGGANQVSCGNFSRQWAIERMNLNTNIYPPLQCSPSWQDVSLPGGSSQEMPDCLLSTIIQNQTAEYGEGENESDFPSSGDGGPNDPFVFNNQNDDFVSNYMEAVTECYCENDISSFCNDLSVSEPQRWASVIDKVDVIDIGTDQGNVVLSTSPEQIARLRTSRNLGRKVVLKAG